MSKAIAIFEPAHSTVSLCFLFFTPISFLPFFSSSFKLQFNKLKCAFKFIKFVSVSDWFNYGEQRSVATQRWNIGFVSSNLAHGSNNNNGMVWHSKCAYSVHICKCDLGNWSSLIKLLNCFETVRKWFYRMQHLNFWILLQQQRNHCPCIGSTNWWLQICERYF